jgi:hypothetical protein
MFQRTRDSWQMTNRKFKIRLFIALVLIVVVLLAFTWVLRAWRGGYQPASEPGYGTELGMEGAEIEKLDDLGLTESKPGPMSYAERTVLDRHFAAIGGVDRLSSISSIRILGELKFTDGSTQEIIIIKKGGDRIRVTTRALTWQRVVVATPEDAWEAIWRTGKLFDVKDIDPEERDSLMRNSYVTSELFMALQNDWEISYVGQKDFNYKMAHCFEVRTGPQELIRFFVDPVTFLDAGREDRLYKEDGGFELVRHIYSDHFDSNGLMVPKLVESGVNEELLHVFHIAQVELNSGILESSFVRPEAPPEPAPTP